MAGIAERLDRTLRAAGLAIVCVSVPDATNRATWRVSPPELQEQAQPIIDAFDPDDPAHEDAELEAQIVAELDTKRLIASVIWVMLRQLFPNDSVAQTKAKFNNGARTQIIAAYKSRPWT
jgi:hypothetical protein